MKHHKIKKKRWMSIITGGICLGLMSGCDFFASGHGLELTPITSQEETAFLETEVMTTVIPMIYIHVAGEVNHPGLYEMPEGSRLYVAIEMAGGFSSQAAQASVNLARILSDGEQIYVSSQEEYIPGQAEGSGASQGKVDVNHAGINELMTLPGVGESKAKAILSYREKNGPFQTVEDLMKVPGIKEAALDKIRDYIVIR